MPKGRSCKRYMSAYPDCRQTHPRLRIGTSHNTSITCKRIYAFSQKESPSDLAKNRDVFVMTRGDWISVGIHDAQSEQIEFGTAVYGALDQLQAVNMSLDWTVASRLLKCGKQRGFIVAEVFCEACQQAAFCAFLPVGPSSCIPFSNHAYELPCQIGAGRDLRGPAT